MSLRNQVVILGAGRSMHGAEPAAMAQVDCGSRVLDWLVGAFAELTPSRVTLVVGYEAEAISDTPSGVCSLHNPDWNTTGPVHSFGLVPLEPDAQTWICYADVVFRSDAVAAMRAAEADVVLAVDRHWQHRYDGRHGALDKAEKVALAGDRPVSIGATLDLAAAQAEFAGLVRLSARATAVARDCVTRGQFSRRAMLPELLTCLLSSGLTATSVDLAGDWAELDAPQDLARFVLGTKAESLERLSRMDHGGVIGDLVAFTWCDWTGNREALVAKVLATMTGERVIVRSSAISEDSWIASHAGQHTSVAGVLRTGTAIAEAVDTVFASYGHVTANDQVLVQAMLDGVCVSGVVMTRSHAWHAPYYVLNFDDQTTRTDVVTSGAGGRTVFLLRSAAGHPGLPALPAVLQPVMATVRRLERLVGHQSLDIEFAVTGDGRVHILQVRPIALPRHPQPKDDGEVDAAVSAVCRMIENRSTPPPQLVGRRTRYSVMSDWNPAEMIGTKPTRLAFSLYRELITDDVWAQQRAEYGYRDVRPWPLLVDFTGHPYVDVRASCNSFVPASVPDAVAGILVDSYLERLQAQTHLHDKVEFDVALTCLTPGIDDRITAQLGASGLSAAEQEQFKNALRALTEAGIRRTPADAARLPGIDATVDRILAEETTPLVKARSLLALARQPAALTFAHLARSAFVATSLLRSLEAVGAVATADVSGFLSSVNTVLGRLRTDGHDVHGGRLDWTTFVGRYGHLRPGTYDITSPCYAARPDYYLGPLVVAPGGAGDHPPPHSWLRGRASEISLALQTSGLDLDADAFEAFARLAIAAREEGKFVYTRVLSALLEQLAEIGASHGLTRDDLSHVAVWDVFGCLGREEDPAAQLQRMVAQGREAYRVTQAMCMPAQIAHTDDLICFEQDAAAPNFVTQGCVEGPLVVYAQTPDADVSGRVVLIASADPGYDWLLARNIRGLITMFGGANSHMAVRAAELGVPAAIGVGELRYAALERARAVRLDCASRSIVVIA